MEQAQIDPESSFSQLARELFVLQFEHNTPYRRSCEVRRVRPEQVTSWAEIPAMPTEAFKELELSCLPGEHRTAVFHSSGTTGQRPSRHFHNSESLSIYEASLLPWFEAHLLADGLRLRPGRGSAGKLQMICLTPTAGSAPHSSLAHMFETVCREFGSVECVFAGKVAEDGGWTLDEEAVIEAFGKAIAAKRPVTILGTAFSFVHLLESLAKKNLRFELVCGSRAMETGGYKGRSRSLSKADLHQLISRRLGIPPDCIVCEYGMSELSSQAYDLTIGEKTLPASPFGSRSFVFPPWARVKIVSPETGREVGEGETGLIRVFDLANVYSVMAVQTEDLGIRHGVGFELLGRAAQAETRGCSLLAC